MRVLNRYLLVDFTVVFSATVLVLTSVMSLGAVIKSLDYAAMGISAKDVGLIFLYHIPYMLSFSLPVSTMVAALLLFGRLSFDGELTAMRSGGINTIQIVTPVMLIAVCLSIGCAWINTEVAPDFRERARKILQGLTLKSPLLALQPGEFVRDLMGAQIMVSSRSNEVIRDVVMHLGDKSGNSFREYRAREGRVREGSTPGEFEIELRDVFQPASGSQWEPAIDTLVNTFMMSTAAPPARISDTASAELLEWYRDPRPNPVEERRLAKLKKGASEAEVASAKQQARSSILVELNKRLALSVACFSFVLIGIPLGIQSKRKDSAAGIGISLGFLLVFFLFIMGADGLVKYPHVRPELVVWIPVLGTQLAGFWLLKRMDQ